MLKNHVGKIISIANQKGGVGKTTTAINLAASVAATGGNILVIDSDPQCNTTSGLGIDKKSQKKNIYNVYLSQCNIIEIIIDTDFDKLYIAPSSLDLLAVEMELVDKEKREWLLADALITIKDNYEFIFIDCPPSLGLLTLNALVAADSVIIPVQCEYYALEGLSMLTNTLELVKNSFNPTLDIEGIVLTMYDTRNSLSRQVAAEVVKFFGSKVFNTIIPRNVTLGEAPSHSKPVIYYDKKSKGSQSYISLAKELLNEKGVR